MRRRTVKEDGMEFTDKETVERIRKRYPRGARVELVSMDDPYSKLKCGELGTVDFVDDTGTVFVNWDSGSGLGAVFGVDVIRRIPDTGEKIMDQIRAIRDSGVTNMFDALSVQHEANRLGYSELVIFIEEQPKDYAKFILTGSVSLLKD
jgi:hypothetical protein